MTDQATTSPAEERRRDIIALKSTFAGEDGQRALSMLKRYVYHGKTVFSPGVPDQTAYWLGKQDVVNTIVNLLAAPLPPADTAQDQIPAMADPYGLPDTNDWLRQPAQGEQHGQTSD